MVCEATFHFSGVFLFFGFFFCFLLSNWTEHRWNHLLEKSYFIYLGWFQVLISFLNSCFSSACLTAGYFPSGLGRFSTKVPFASVLTLEHIDGWQVNIWNWFHMNRSTKHALFRSSAFMWQMRAILSVYARQTLYAWRYMQSNAFDILKMKNGMCK